MSVQRASQHGSHANRWGLLAMLGLSAILLAAFGRVAQLQLAPGQELQAFMGERQSQRSDKSWRGDLLDRRGRPIALSRVGMRAFIDPMRLSELEPAEITGAITALAEALELPLGDVDERVRERLRASDQRVREGKGPLRFAAVSEMLDDSHAGAVRSLAISGIHLEQRDIRETIVSDSLSRLVGLVGFEHEGRLGAELELEKALRSTDGSLRYLRDAQGRPLWVERGHWTPGADGRDISLSIDLELQRIAEEELWRGIYDADAVGGRLVMLDPRTGEVLAMTDLVRTINTLEEYPWEDKGAPRGQGLPPPGPDGSRYITLPPDAFRDKHPATSRNRCVQDMYEPGSTFKPFIWAAITQAGLVETGEVINTHNGFWRTSYGRSIEDVTRRSKMTWSEVLVNSSNIGMVQGGERIEPADLRAMLRAFGFGQKTGIMLPGEMGGLMTSLGAWSHWTQTSVAFGHEVAVTPIQMARAFCCFARTGTAAGTLPDLSLVALRDGDPLLDVLRPVVRPDVAVKVREVLTHVATKMEAVMERKNPEDSGWRYRIFGKSGTAEIPTGPPPEGKRRPSGSRGYFEDQYNSSFIAGGPFEDPRVVVLVIIDDPGPEHVFQPALRRTHYGSHVAGPVVRRVIERSLDYMGVPASDPDLKIEIERVNKW